MKRILVPINFSESSGASLRYAHLLAKQLNVNLTLLHCYPIREYNRIYNFGDKDYDMGISEMLKEFYKKYVDEQSIDTRYIAQPGPVSDFIASTSKLYDLVILSGNKFSSNVTRWLGSKVSYIASKSQCPVLILPSSEKFLGYSGWKKIWHIKRRENETEVIESNLPKLKINRELVQVKTFNQTTFKSAFWRSIVAYIDTPKEELQEAIIEARLQETIDLILLVSHGEDSFEKFVKNDSIQIIFRFDIPVLIFQAHYKP